MKYKDYYATLGVDRKASAKDIKKAYRKQARKYHPDVNHSPDAEEKFKDAAEAFEVIGNEDNRKKYDQLGANWKKGQDFSAPPGWGSQGAGSQYQYYSGGQASPEEFGDFSDFFSSMFGGGMGGTRSGTSSPGAQWKTRGQDHEADIEISLEDAFYGTKQNIALQTAEVSPDGQVLRKTKNIHVTIPAGTGDNSRIRLADQGGAGVGGGQPGHLYLRVHIKKHPRFTLQGRNLLMQLPVAPWEAALGKKITIETIDHKKAAITLPPAAQSGKLLRMKGKGLPAIGKKHAGDLIVEIIIKLPEKLSEKERKLFEELAETSTFNARRDP